MVGLFGDVVTTLSGEYNYFDPALVPFMNPQEIINKFLALSPMAIAYGLLNGFYEEFFFLGLMTSVKEEHQWKAFSILNTRSFLIPYVSRNVWAIIIGVVYGLFYYFMYKKVVKNLLPFFLMHALADMFGSTFIYLLIAWAY